MKTFLVATTLFVCFFLHLLAVKPHKHVFILVSAQSQEHLLNYGAGVRETPKWASHMRVKWHYIMVSTCHFPTKMLPTLCREFSNLVCLGFEESWLWQQVSHLKCQLQFLHKKNDWCSREIRWKWCYFEQKVLLEVFCLISDKSGVVQHSNLFLSELDWSVRIWTFCAF